MNGILHGQLTRLEVATTKCGERDGAGGAEVGGVDGSGAGDGGGGSGGGGSGGGGGGGGGDGGGGARLAWWESRPSEARDDERGKLNYCGQHILPDGTSSGDEGLGYVSGTFSPLAFM